MKKPNSEIIFHNSESRETQIWFMEGGTIARRRTVEDEDSLPIFVGVPWTIVGAGHFKFRGGLAPDGGADILWRNTADQQLQIWTLEGWRITARLPIMSEDNKVPMRVGPPWEIIGFGDFHRSGGTDILWRNTATLQTQVWFMDGSRISGRQTLVAENNQTPMTIGPPWEVIGVGDFDRDGGADILFRNVQDNQTQVWLMDGHRVRARPPLHAEDNKSLMTIGAPWQVVGVGDFNNDGGADIVFRNVQDNQTQIWFMDGTRVSSRRSILTERGASAMRIGPPWRFAGVAKAPVELRDPAALPAPFMFRVNTVEVLTQKSDADHSDSDWMSFVVTIGNTVTKSQRTFQVAPRLIAASARTGSSFGGVNTSPLTVDTNDIVTINCLVMNLGSSRAEDQFAQAVKVTDQVVKIAAPAIGAAIGLFFGGNLTEGLEIGKKVAAAVDDAISGLGDVFDFLGIHFGPPNCNGEVLSDAFVYLPGELSRSAGKPGVREYTGPQSNGRCGDPPRTRLHFDVIKVPAIGFVPPES